MKLNERSKKNLAGVHPDLVRLMEEAIKDCPVDFTITEGIRTMERQQELYAQGRTLPGIIVTHVDGIKKKSKHQQRADGYGYAVDLYPVINGKVDVCAVDELKIIGNHICDTAHKLDISIRWGGNWKFKDYPHFELNG